MAGDQQELHTGRWTRETAYLNSQFSTCQGPDQLFSSKLSADKLNHTQKKKSLVLTSCVLELVP